MRAPGSTFPQYRPCNARVGLGRVSVTASRSYLISCAPGPGSKAPLSGNEVER